MQVLGILVRTKTDRVTELSFSYANKVIEVSRTHGHILVDLAAEAATRSNLLRVLESVGLPVGNFLRIIIFYCSANAEGPLDQEGRPFITEELLPKFNGWGMYSMGSNVGKNLSHRLLMAGATFVISFSSKAYIPLNQPALFFDNFNAGIIRLLTEGISPSLAAEHVRDLFLTASQRLMSSARVSSQVLAVFLHDNAIGTQFSGPELLSEFRKILPGRNHAANYQVLVAKALGEIFDGSLFEPHYEVTNSSGASRYDIVFMNKAERGFWHDLKINWGNNLVIFDAKNKGELKPSDADQMLRYSSSLLGRVLFVVCRKSQSKTFAKRAADYLNKHKVCILVLTDSDLETMLTAKLQSRDPTSVVEGLYRERLETS
jgi:hypothetical protein